MRFRKAMSASVAATRTWASNQRSGSWKVLATNVFQASAGVNAA